jgi:hypothetical protein
MSRAERVEEAPPAFEALLNYLADTTEIPESYGGVRQDVAEQKRKGKYIEFKIPIYNGRAIADRLSLEDEGFVLVQHNTQVKNFYDQDQLTSVYYKETEDLVKRVSGAQRVLVFDHTLRAADSEIRDKNQVSSPVRNVHNDYTEWSGPQRVRDLLPNEAEDLISRRFAVVQTWRPINKPVQNEHLAIADARTIATGELVSSARIYPNRRGEVYHLTHNPAHRWYYFPNMQRNEAMVFKCYDSLKDGRARWTAHCAFEDPTAPPNVPPRESIEMRTLAFF